MWDEMAGFLSGTGLTWIDAIWAVGLFLLTFVASLIEVTILLISLPATYFQKHHPRQFWREGHPWLRILAIIGKNLLGVFHIVLGVLLSLPGVPGQGILTILIGVMLLDIPGVRWVERKIVGRPKVFGSINRIRARFRRPPLILDGEPREVPASPRLQAAEKRPA